MLRNDRSITARELEISDELWAESSSQQASFMQFKDFDLRKFAFAAICILATSSFVNGASLASGRSSDAEARAKMNYDMGKKLFQEKVVCATCRYADLKLDSETVRLTWPDLECDLNADGAIGKDLRIAHRHAIRVFIKKRFDL